MPLPYTPDRPLDPPDSVDDEKELCIQCGEYYEPYYMNRHFINLEPITCCDGCLEELTKN